MKMDNKMIAIIVIAVIAIAFVGLYMSGYIKSGKVSSFKSQREVSSAIVNISSDIQSIGSTLEDIDKGIG